MATHAPRARRAHALPPHLLAAALARLDGAAAGGAYPHVASTRALGAHFLPGRGRARGRDVAFFDFGAHREHRGRTRNADPCAALAVAHVCYAWRAALCAHVGVLVEVCAWNDFGALEAALARVDGTRSGVAFTVAQRDDADAVSALFGGGRHALLRRVAQLRVIGYADAPLDVLFGDVACETRVLHDLVAVREGARAAWPRDDGEAAAAWPWRGWHTPPTRSWPRARALPGGLVRYAEASAPLQGAWILPNGRDAVVDGKSEWSPREGGQARPRRCPCCTTLYDSSWAVRRFSDTFAPRIHATHSRYWDDDGREMRTTTAPERVRVLASTRLAQEHAENHADGAETRRTRQLVVVSELVTHCTVALDAMRARSLASEPGVAADTDEPALARFRDTLLEMLLYDVHESCDVAIVDARAHAVHGTAARWLPFGAPPQTAWTEAEEGESEEGTGAELYWRIGAQQHT